MFLNSLSDKVYVTVLLEKTIHLRFYNHIGVLFFFLSEQHRCMHVELWGRNSLKRNINNFFCHQLQKVFILFYICFLFYVISAQLLNEYILQLIIYSLEFASSGELA